MPDAIANFFDPGQRELDMFLLSALVFLPAAAAILLMLFPPKWKEAMRWFALFAMAGQLALSLCAVIDYYNRVLDLHSDRSVRTLYNHASMLDVRVEKQISDVANQRAYSSIDMIVRRPWIEAANIYYSLGVDGINLSLVVLSAFVSLTAIVAGWKIETGTRGFLALILLLQTGVTGAFLSLDFFLFYVFYELMLVPMYFLIGIWGGARRKYAAIKFVIYTLVGSVGILAAMIALATADARDFVDQQLVVQRMAEIKRANTSLTTEQAFAKAEIHTFDIATLSKMGRAVMLVLTGRENDLEVQGKPGEAQPAGEKTIALFAPGVDRVKAIERLKAQPVCTRSFQTIVFILLFVGFAVKLPIVPLHSWLPDAHVEAPTPVSMILAGVLLKVGGYGLIRIAWPICPYAASQGAWWLALLGVIGILYGAFVALGQTDFKKLLAYSSVSHMGFVLLGIASWPDANHADVWEQGVSGALFQMIAHGITASALFFCVGVVYDRAHHRDLNRLGGLTESMPFFTGLSAVLFFASMALPGLCGFVGEFFVLCGAWNYSVGLTIPAVLSTILTAAYLLWTWQKVYWGTNDATKSFPEVTPREWSVLVPYVLLAIGVGVLPGLLVFHWCDPSITGWVANLAVLK
ncbi:MAG: NADH-quinone oxidoreductase subunit M [Gemmataceae bacterium]